MPHLIQRLIIEANELTHENTARKQDELLLWAKRSDLWQKVEAVLDAMDEKDKIIKIPYLELSINAKNEEDFVAQFVTQLSKEVKQAIFFSQNPTFISKKNEHYSNISITGARENTASTLLYFLNNGFLPSTFLKESIDNFQDYIEKLPFEKNVYFYELLKKSINENVWWRFWQLLGEEKIITFSLQYTDNQKDIKIWLKEIISTLDDKKEKAACLKHFFIQNENIIFENKKQLEKIVFEKNEIENIDNQVIVLESEDTFYVENAGIVLLAAYFHQLFSALNFLENGFFKDVATQQKAILLIHYIATGKENDVWEYELPLCKLLCGYPIAQPLDNDNQLSSEEKEIANQLITFAISQWTIMKNSSVEGLQTNFLQRKGKLYKTEENQWHLKINRQAEDILLDRLPFGWSYTMIKNVWSESMIYVEWSNRIK